MQRRKSVKSAILGARSDVIPGPAAGRNPESRNEGT